jgi:hypothetical protein
MLRAGVPETAVDEHDELSLREHDVSAALESVDRSMIHSEAQTASV